MKSYELTLPCQLAYALNCACVYSTIFSGKAAIGTVAYNGPARRETSARSVRCRTGWQGALQQDKKNEQHPGAVALSRLPGWTSPLRVPIYVDNGSRFAIQAPENRLVWD